MLKNKLYLVLSLVMATLLPISFAAGEYYGFDSYEAYLQNYYAYESVSNSVSNAELPTVPTSPVSHYAATENIELRSVSVNNAAGVRTIKPITVFTATPVGVNTVAQQDNLSATTSQYYQYYNGFSSYDAYLNNYYATIGNLADGRSITPSNLTPLQTSSCLSANDILNIDVEGQYLSCDGTLYTVTQNANSPVATPEFAVNYNIAYQRIIDVKPEVVKPEVVTPEVATPVYVYPEVTEIVSAPEVVAYRNVQALDFQVGFSYTFNDDLKLTLLELNDNRCFAGQYCAHAGEVVAKFRTDLGNQSSMMTVRLEPGEEAEANFLLANTSIKFTGINYDTTTGKAALQSVVRRP